MPRTGREVYADAAAERLFTSATIITIVRTVVSLGFSLAGAYHHSLTLLIVGLVVYWVGDSLDGEVARRTNCETRIGAVLDMFCDRLNCAGFYLGEVWLHPIMGIPISVYLLEFMVVDSFLSLAFLAWPIRSPNYFYVVDHRLWVWNWSRMGKAANSGAFAVLLLVTGWWWFGLIIALGLLVLKCVSVRWLLQLGMPVPDRVPA